MSHLLVNFEIFIVVIFFLSKTATIANAIDFILIVLKPFLNIHYLLKHNTVASIFTPFIAYP